MFAERKRGHFSFYWSLPAVVAIMFLLAAKLAALQRAEIIAEFAQQVAKSDTAEATAAVRHLAAMPRPPIACLVEAAASPNLDVAREAQFAIDNYLRHCQLEIKADRRAKATAAQLTLLAETLARQCSAFSVNDYNWVERTTRKVLELANQTLSHTTPVLAMHCDEVLAAVSANLSPAVIPSAATAETNEASRSGEALPKEDIATAPGRDPLKQDRLGSYASLPTVTLPFSSTELADSGWQADWTFPALRALPAMPIGAVPIAELGNVLRQPTGKLQPERIGTIDEAGIGGQQLEKLDSRGLLSQWLVAEGASVFPIEQELTARGFGRLSARLVRRLFSDQPEVRLRLVDDVLTQPGVDARPWLMLLAEDTDSDVRLVVVTIMATSNDSTLIEKAWQVAIRDHDPRIAGMAGRLRERRADSQRR